MVISLKKLDKYNLNFEYKFFFSNLRLSFVLKMFLTFGKISASCPYKLCPYSEKRVLYTRTASYYLNQIDVLRNLARKKVFLL